MSGMSAFIESKQTNKTKKQSSLAHSMYKDTIKRLLSMNQEVSSWQASHPPEP